MNAKPLCLNPFIKHANANRLSVSRNQYERMGSDVTMQCGYLDDEASVSWKVNGTDVRARHRVDGPRLVLTNVDLGHNGLYSCFQNPRGERRDTILLRIGSKGNATLRAMLRATGSMLPDT